nr:hypothetical protein [Tanacetum cinerariifolium]
MISMMLRLVFPPWRGVTEGNLEEAKGVRKAIALLRQAIRSSLEEKTGTAKLESTRGDSVVMDKMMNNVEWDELIHIEMVKIVVEVEDCYKLHLHGVHVVEDMHEADQNLKEEPIEEEPLEEQNEEGQLEESEKEADSDLLLDARSRPGLANSDDSCKSKVKPNQHVVIPVIDEEKTLIFEEVSRSKILANQKDPISKEKKINTTPINYVELNQLFKDFGKHCVPQQELSAEQAFWLQTSNPNTKKSNISPVRIEAPNELPKVNLVNTSLKKLKIYLSKFDTVMKKRITPDAIIEGEWGFELTKAVFLNEIIPFLTTLKDIFNIFDKDLLNEDIQLTVMNSTTIYSESVNLEMQSSECCDKCFDLDVELLKKKNVYMLGTRKCRSLL